MKRTGVLDHVELVNGCITLDWWYPPRAMMLQPNRRTSTFVLFASMSLAAASLAACEAKVPPPGASPHAPGTSAPATSSVPAGTPDGTDSGSVDESALNPTVAPCDDFYEHACGGWLAKTPIPPEESSWTRSFDEIRERNEGLLRKILEQNAKAPPADQPYSKALGDYYASCMDEEAIEKAGTKPVEHFFEAIGRVNDARSLAALLGDFHRKGVGGLFDFDSGQDFKDATQVIGHLSQGGLGLPDRDYYLKDDPKMKALRRTYEAHVAKMLALAGENEAAAQAQAKSILAFETALARASMPLEEQRDPRKIYHRLDRAGLVKDAPGFAWAEYFKSVGAPDVKALNVAQPNFFRAVDSLTSPKAKKFPGPDLHAYLRFHLLSSLSHVLPKRFVDASFELERALTGAETLPPRWKRCVREVGAVMGEAVAVPFVHQVLGEEGKKDVLQMVMNIEAAMGKRLDALQWMDEPTRAKAREKLAAVSNKIGYPDKFRSYDGLVVKRGEALGNRLHAVEFEVRRQLAKIGKPLDRSEWFFPPHTVNAAYDPGLNEMQFPAGILQSPFYSKKAPPSLNYGAIGMVIGHELTHGFDDEGRRFDARGNLTDWWSPPVDREFDKRAACVEKQFGQYTVAGGVHLNGRLTLGENIADLGGLKLAYAARSKAPGAQRGDSRYSDEQQFFYGYAQAWCTNIRDEQLRLMAQTDPHSPARFRVNGPLSNTQEFQEAFQCKPGPMVRAERCEVW